MAKSPNQKLKLLYLAKIFASETDAQHGLTTAQLIGRLSDQGIAAERKTLYTDFEELRRFGLDIISQQDGRQVRYSLASRQFELAELKLLVDSVQSARFITEKKSRELIHKLEELASVHEGSQLRRQVYLSGRVKTMNESVYYNVDSIHAAIGANVQIRFQYFQWNAKKEPELRHNGDWYQISPWCLLCESENYYLLGYDAQAEKMKHYRVDKMLHIKETPLPRQGKALFEELDIPSYARSLFGMYGGQETRVTLEGENRLAGAIIDRFGRDIPMRPVDEEHFRATVEVAVSDQFLGWVAGLGTGIKIVGPESVVEAMREHLRRLSAMYEKP